MTITLFSHPYSSPYLIGRFHYKAEVVQEGDRLLARLVFTLTGARPYQGVFPLGDALRARKAVRAAAKRRGLIRMP